MKTSDKSLFMKDMRASFIVQISEFFIRNRINFFKQIAMKKMLLAVGVFCLIQNTHAQTVVDFEDLTLPGADTAWLGIDQSGGFTSHGVFFENTYNTTYNFWSKFCYSNSTNTTTPGSSNDYSAYTGSGANGSANYAIYNGGNIDFNGEREMLSISVTNNTYAALSMLNGDAFGKQFGSINNAQGTPDGTNGEDWFRLLIIGVDQNGDNTDTVTFYLADYRFANNAQDYIVNTWQSVDLTSLGSVYGLNFALESSDVGGWGMNTPAYFALDNLSFNNFTGLEEQLSSTIHVYPNPTNGMLSVEAENGTLSVYNVSGTRLLTKDINGSATIDLSTNTAGTYFVELTNASGTTRTRIVKN